MRRRLDVELVRRGLVASRRQAADVIAAGRVLVDGAPAPRAARRVAPSESVRILEAAPRFVSRGGEKLDGALDAFGIDVAGARALDAGASTGGFTDCLLQRGAASVVALDVGRGQLAWSLRTDARVTLLEGVNLRALDPSTVGAPFDVVVADLSFISLTLVTEPLAAAGAGTTDWVLLVKPQFEVGRGEVGSGGVVRDPQARARAVRDVVAALARAGIVTTAVAASRLPGADGNREVFVHGRRAGSPVDDDQIRRAAGVPARPEGIEA